MNKLTKLSIKKFRNVEPTTLEFRPGLNVLLGKNAAGKTTLLRLLAAGASSDDLQNDELDVTYHLSGESLDLEHTITRTRVNEPTLPLDPATAVREEASSLQQVDSFVLLLKTGGVIAKAQVFPNEVVLDNAEKVIRVARWAANPPFIALVQALVKLEKEFRPDSWATGVLSAQVQSAGRMDESLERFEELLGLEVTRRSDGRGGYMNRDNFPLSMSPVFLGPTPEEASAVFSLEFLDRAARVLGYESAKARFDVERLSATKGEEVVRQRNLRFFFKRPGEEISHALLSYGQKRLLAFFAHADASRDVIIADELVNGLHHEWISACLSEIGSRQAFLTSQNPLLLDFLRFESAEDVRRTFILCERVKGESGARLIWRNPSEEEAQSFFSAYEVGIQRVSDILLTKGLW